MSAYRVRGPQIVHETVDGEVIAIDFVTGSYYSMREGAEAVWSAVVAAGQPTADDVSTAVAERFAGHRPEHVAAFLDQLVEEGLLERDGDPSGGTDPGTLAFEKFTDMEELILLDPVHDVSEAGWPNAPA